MRRRAILTVGLIVGSSSAFALNTAIDVTQYAHKAWTVSDGTFKGIIFTIAQTPDGYLWIATDSGLVRFDGVRAVPWAPPAGERLPSSDVRALRTARDGRLWIGTTRGLASWKDGTLAHYPRLDGLAVGPILEDREGTIWVSGWSLSPGILCRIHSGTTECTGADGRFGSGVTALYEDSGGTLWAGAMTGLWRLKPGPPTAYAVPDPDNQINALLESEDGGILVVKDSGISRLRSGKAEPFPLPAALHFQPGRLFRDRDGGLWIGAVVDGGLLHYHDGRIDRFTRSDGLSDNAVRALLEDHEGNIWVATVDGLDRFRDFAVRTISTQQGLSSHAVSSVVAARDGTVWIATDNGLNRWRNGDVTVYRKQRAAIGRGGSPVRTVIAGTAADSRGVREVIDSGLPADSVDSVFEDSRGQIWVTTHEGVAVRKSDRFTPVRSLPHGVVFSIAEDRLGTVWLSHREALFGVAPSDAVQRISWAALGRVEPAIASHHDPAQGGVWLGFGDGAVAYFERGQLTPTYAVGEAIGSLHVDPRGTLWAASARGLSRLKDGRVLTLTSQNGLPCNAVHWMIDDDADTVWLYTACGLVRIAESELDAWASAPQSAVHVTLFDHLDGVRSHQFHYGYSGIVTRAAGGEIWFAPFGGLNVFDPHHLPVNTRPPPVHIEQLVVDGKTYSPANGVRLPPRVRDVSIAYTALSFVAPERVRVRYMLEGQDRGWKDVVNDRQAQYSNLLPGGYRFRVLASNNSGVWNETGATLDFSIAPAYYQTRWFAALVLVATGTLLFVAYRLRVAQLARQFNRTLDARVSERTRIARDLHDTLLQSLQGLLLRFHSALTLLPARPDEARERLEGALDQAEAAINEGRDAVRGLRASVTTVNDLANGIAAIGAEISSDRTPATSPAIDVAIVGPSRDLNPLVRDEAYRLAGEALRNAVKHAQARRVTVKIFYEVRQLRLIIRDDGKGIDAQTLARQQATGHFGLPGMRERASVVNGQLDVRSTAGVGTEIELRVPAAIAYAASGPRHSWWSRVSHATKPTIQ